MRHYMVETLSSYRKSISCVKPWSDRSWTIWRHSAEMRWDKTGNTKNFHRISWVVMLTMCDCFWGVMQWLVPAAEHTASGCSGLFPVWCPVGSWGPEEQQTEPAVYQPVEPQPQTRVLWDPDVGELTHTHRSRLCQLGQDSWIDPPSAPPPISALGSDTGVHQTPGPATWHDPPNGRGPETGSAVPHLNFSLRSKTCDCK